MASKQSERQKKLRFRFKDQSKIDIWLNNDLVEKLNKKVAKDKEFKSRNDWFLHITKKLNLADQPNISLADQLKVTISEDNQSYNSVAEWFRNEVRDYLFK